MKVLFANNFRGYYGGVEQVVEDYAVGLAQRGHECFLAYGKDGRDVEQYKHLFLETYACRQFGSGKKGYTFIEIVQSVAPDVVFVHKISQLPPGFEEASSYRKILMVHDHDLWCPKRTGYYTGSRRNCRVKAGLPCYLDGAFLERRGDGLFPFKLRSLQDKFNEMRRNHNFDTILVLSEYLKKQLILNGFPPERVEIHNPVVKNEVPECQPLSRTSRVLFVGSLVRGKGVDLLLRALASMSCPFEIDIVGTGEYEGRLRSLAVKLNITDHCHFLGWIPHAELSSYYKNARVVAVPSCWPEPFGLVGQEAMHYARPVVAFNVGGIRDWCDNEVTGLLVQEQDVAGFAQALERLLTDFELAQELGRAGLGKVQRQFSFEDNLEELEVHLLGHQV